MPIATINPATGETLKTFESLTQPQLEDKLERAANTFRSYRSTSFAEREALMLRAAEILESDKSRLARLMTIEMGKPIKGAGQEIEKCALVCRYYAETAKRHLADQMVETNASQELCPLSADRTRAGRHALELPFLASFPFRSAGTDGR